MILFAPVILCGGSGTRLWPQLRAGFLKQFLCLTGNESLFQQAAQKLAALDHAFNQLAAPVIVSGVDHRFLASEQLREVGIALGRTLLESVGRYTAPTCPPHGARRFLSESGYYWNPGIIPLEIIDVQSVSHLGEEVLVLLKTTFPEPP